MRALADADRIRAFMRALARAAVASGRVYLTGGATAVLHGWRAATLDVDIKLVPDADALLRAIPQIKESLDVNVELASPDDFIPVKDGWADRSPFIGREGLLSFHHFDLYAQALAKIERSHETDRVDVAALMDRRLIDPDRLQDYFDAIADNIYRYPAIDASSFRRAVLEAVARGKAREGQ
ncbi:MAG: DUF6036 family nucleotidyltransferase [Vicinamibacterales bacterium]